MEDLDLTTIVLSGGGVKAAAHLGAMRALREAGVTPTRFLGTSMGAVMAAALASGLSPEEVIVRTRGIRRRDVARLSGAAIVQWVFAAALFQREPLQRTIARLVPAARFDQLKFPLTITATDVESGEEVIFGDGGEDAPLVDALYASCALPLWYPSIEINGRTLADGGLRGPLPLSAAIMFPASRVIAIDAGPGFDALPSTGRLAPPAFIRAHSNASRILMAHATELELDLWRLSPDRPPLMYVRPVVERTSTFSTEDVDRYDKAGYDATRNVLTNGLPRG